MKQEAKACWRTELRRLRRLLSIALFAATVCISACTPHVGDDEAIHLTRAQLLVTSVIPGTNFAQPPSEMTAQMLPAGQWQDVSLPHQVLSDRQRIGGANELDWYRLDVADGLALATPRYLYLPRWKNSGKIAIYANGKLLYQTEGSLAYNGFNRPLLIRLEGNQPTQAITLLLRLEHQAGSRSTLSTLWVGSSSALAWRYQVRQFLQIQLPFMGAAAFLVVGLFSLAVWVRRRREWVYFVFFAASTLAFVRMLHYVIGGTYLPVSDAWFTWLTVASLMWLIVLVNNFLERLHKRSVHWLHPALTAVMTILTLVTVPGATSLIPDLERIIPVLYLMLAPLTVVIFFAALRYALQSGAGDIKLMAAWVMFSVPCSIYDLGLQNNWVGPEGIYTHPYAIIGLFVMFTYIMYGRYMGAIDKVEEVNASLAERLQKREVELAASYERLREIEHRQTISQERQRLMQDMHDGLGATLISAIRSVEGGGMSDEKVSQILKDCMDDLKLAIDSMEPVEADLLLLLATLRFRLEPRLEGTGIALIWEVKEMPALDWLDPSSALHILRILQEVFANILKHTQATIIRVSTDTVGDGVQVSITDNGSGFDVEQTLSHSAGRGLHNQRRRAESIDGKVSWVAGQTGTQFRLYLPLKRYARSI